jgi:thiamine-phosphate pyrophosphorylase
MKLELPIIYPITDKALARKENHYGILKELVRGGARFVQIRDKSTPTDELLKDLSRCVEFASIRNVTLVINDRCDLALSCGATGVHLGQDDLHPVAARKLLGEDAVIGYSTHTLSQVRAACLLPVQYIGFGPVFATATKQNTHPAVGLKRLGNACRQSKLPVVAIGGIGLTNVRDVLAAGASSVAVISSLLSASDIAGKMEALIEAATEK